MYYSWELKKKKIIPNWIKIIFSNSHLYLTSLKTLSSSLSQTLSLTTASPQRTVAVDPARRPSPTIHLPSHLTGNPSPPTHPTTFHLPPQSATLHHPPQPATRRVIGIFFSFWVNFFVNFCLMILVPLGVFV